MYNRYIRNDDGRYERVPVQEHWEQPEQPQAPPPDPVPPPESEENRPPPPPHGGGGGWNGPPPPSGGKKKGFLSDILGRLNLDGIDTGDLLLLLILFLLFKDGEDEELLIALGLLLIL